MITAETMLARRSVRSYDGRPIEAETLEKVKGFADRIQNPFGIPVRFVILDAKEKGLSSPVLTGEPLYVAGKVDKVPYGDVAFGFAMEELLLFAWSLGLGSVWIGGRQIACAGQNGGGGHHTGSGIPFGGTHGHACLQGSGRV